LKLVSFSVRLNARALPKERKDLVVKSFYESIKEENYGNEIYTQSRGHQTLFYGAIKKGVLS